MAQSERNILLDQVSGQFEKQIVVKQQTNHNSPIILIFLIGQR